jgi:hypothetical protein
VPLGMEAKSQLTGMREAFWKISSVSWVSISIAILGVQLVTWFCPVTTATVMPGSAQPRHLKLGLPPWLAQFRKVAGYVRWCRTGGAVALTARSLPKLALVQSLSTSVVLYPSTSALGSEQPLLTVWIAHSLGDSRSF